MAVTGRTNGTFICTSQGDTITGRLVVQTIAHKQPTASNSPCKVGTGTAYAGVVFQTKSTGSNAESIQVYGKLYNGLKVLSLGSGIVEIVTI